MRPMEWKKGRQRVRKLWQIVDKHRSQSLFQLSSCNTFCSTGKIKAPFTCCSVRFTSGKRERKQRKRWSDNHQGIASLICPQKHLPPKIDVSPIFFFVPPEAYFTSQKVSSILVTEEWNCSEYFIEKTVRLEALLEPDGGRVCCCCTAKRNASLFLLPNVVHCTSPAETKT